MYCGMMMTIRQDNGISMAAAMIIACSA